jgi:hypothetical protein
MPDAEHKPVLIFVYNADSGFFNLLADMAHKAFSPDTYNCQLCKRTHGHTGMRDHWKDYLETIHAELVFLHRDEFIKQYGEHNAALPALFVESEGIAELFMSEADINTCETLDALIAKLDGRLNDLGQAKGRSLPQRLDPRQKLGDARAVCGDVIQVNEKWCNIPKKAKQPLNTPYFLWKIGVQEFESKGVVSSEPQNSQINGVLGGVYASYM